MASRLLMQVNEGREPAIDPRTNKPTPRGPRWYPHTQYWLRRWRDGTMTILDPGAQSPDVLKEASEGSKVDKGAKVPMRGDTAVKPSGDTAIKTTKQTKARK